MNTAKPHTPTHGGPQTLTPFNALENNICEFGAGRPDFEGRWPRGEALGKKREINLKKARRGSGERVPDQNTREATIDYITESSSVFSFFLMRLMKGESTITTPFTPSSASDWILEVLPSEWSASALRDLWVRMRYASSTQRHAPKCSRRLDTSSREHSQLSHAGGNYQWLQERNENQH